MSLADLIIAHHLLAQLPPDELEELEDLLERAPLPAPRDCRVPLRELHREVAAHYGEKCRAAQELEALIP